MFVFEFLAALLVGFCGAALTLALLAAAFRLDNRKVWHGLEPAGPWTAQRVLLLVAAAVAAIGTVVGYTAVLPSGSMQTVGLLPLALTGFVLWHVLERGEPREA